MPAKSTYEELEQRIEELENDVLRQAQADGPLLESEEVFRLAFKNANIGMCLVDTEGRIVKVNAEMSNIFGYSQAELEGMTVNNITHPEDLDISPDFIQRASSGEITQAEFEKRYIHKNGHTVWGQVVSSLVRDSKGTPLYFISHVKDITKHKQSEEALRNIEHEKEVILDSLLENVIYVDPEMKILWANQAACKSADLTRNKLIGSYCYELWADSSQPCADCVVIKAMKTGKTQEIEKTTPDGRSWFNRGYPVKDEKNNIIGGIEVTLDITERKQAKATLRESEEKYRLLVNNLPGIVYQGFKDWSVEFYDDKITMLTGYDMFEFNSRRVKWIDLIIKDDIAPAQQTFIQALKSDKSYVRDYRIKTKAGTITWIRERGYIVCAQNGDIEYISGVFYDITDLKTAEKELKKSQALLHSTIESLPFDFFAMDNNGRYVLQNSSSRQRWGSIVGKHPEDLAVSKKRLVSWLEDNRRAFSGEIVQREMQYIHEGKQESHHSVVAPIVGESEILGILGANIDITERKLAEDKTRKSEKKYRELWEGLRNGAVAVDMEGRIIEFNPAFQKMIGYNAEEIYKLTYKDITPQKWHSLEAQILEEQVLIKGYSEIYEKEFIKKNGVVFPIELITYLVQDKTGNPEGMWATISDITDRKKAEKVIKESEERYRKLYRDSRQREQLYESLLNATPDAVAIYNLNGETIFINPAFTRTFGFSMEDVQGKRIPFVPESEADKTKAGIEKVLAGEPVTGFETRRMTKDGRILDISLSSSCYYDHEGSIAGILVFLRDVTAAKHLEKQLLHYNKMEAVGTLAGGIAHDFNNLLQAIQGYAEILLLDKDIIDSAHRELQQISHAAKRGSELTRQLLTFSRKVESKKLLIDLNREVKQAHTMLKRTIPKMIKIELNLEEQLKTIDADPNQVEQVLMNLAINAKDAMPEGGQLIIKTENATLDEEFCRTHLGSSPGDCVLLTVADTGHGMDKKTLEHIFDPFFTTKEVGQGTGLGLAIVYGIVKSHYGYITSHSELGQGTTIQVYFPAVEQQAEPEEKETGAPIQGGTETILLVDDEKYIRDLATQMLEQFGYKVLTAVDGESALDLYRIKQDKIHLVILDLIMPGMGGKQCLADLLKLNSKIKVVVISGFSDTIPIQETIAAGAKDFIAKPFKIRKMLAKIRNVLDE